MELVAVALHFIECGLCICERDLHSEPCYEAAPESGGCLAMARNI
jgi:hypothetical protein